MGGRIAFQLVPCGVRHVACCTRRVAFCIWQAAYGMWRGAYGKWSMAFGMVHAVCVMRHVDCACGGKFRLTFSERVNFAWSVFATSSTSDMQVKRFRLAALRLDDAEQHRLWETNALDNTPKTYSKHTRIVLEMLMEPFRHN